MTFKIIDCVQGTDEWFHARMGMPTASKFSHILAQGEGKMRRKYLLQLAGEIITGKPAREFKNEMMDRGNEMQAEASSAYSLLTDQKVVTVGFITNDTLVLDRTIGASPDGLIGRDGGCEFKTHEPHILIERLLGNVREEHEAQIQGNMWVTEREWWEHVAYYPGMPIYKRRYRRDDRFIAKLKIATSAFLDDLTEVVEQVRKYGKEAI